MKDVLSAFLDGEAEDHEIRGLMASVRSDEAVREASSVYCLIGDSLRNEPALDRDLVSGVMQALADGPVVLAPVVRKRAATRPLLALAASAAGVAVVGWLALVPRLPSPTSPALVRAQSIAPTRSEPVVLAKATPRSAPNPAAGERNMQEYLLAHQASISGLQLPSPAGHIRPVSAVGKE